MIHLTKIRYFGNFPILNFLCFSLFALVIFNSCISLRSIDVQIAKKEPFPLPENIQSIAIINHAMHSGFSNYSNDSLVSLFSRYGGVNSQFRDSMAADTAIQVIAKVLYESERYDVVIPLYRNILRNDTLPLTEQLQSSFIEGICNDFHTDAVLVLESIEESLDALPVSYFHTEIPVKYIPGLNELTKVSFKASYNSVWRIYTVCDSCDIKQYNIEVTKSWRGNFGNLPKLKEVLIDGGTASGMRFAKYISPVWENYFRNYFVTYNKQIDAAIPLIFNNKWEEAAAVWSKYSAIPSESIRSKVEFNLALASEMNGNLNLAMEWCGKSLQSAWSYDKMAYLNTLEQRQKESEKDVAKRAFY